MRNYIKFTIVILFIITSQSCSRKYENQIDEYNVSIDSLKKLPNNFYAFRDGSVYIDTEKYMIWFNRDFFGNIKNVYAITDLSNHNENQIEVIEKYKIDTIENKIIAQKFIDLSDEFKFHHINILKNDKITISYTEDLPEQYVMALNDRQRKIYMKDSQFKLLKNGWFKIDFK